MINLYVYLEKDEKILLNKKNDKIILILNILIKNILNQNDFEQNPTPTPTPTSTPTPNFK